MNAGTKSSVQTSIAVIPGFAIQGAAADGVVTL